MSTLHEPQFETQPEPAVADKPVLRPVAPVPDAFHEGWRELALYLAAGAAYITIGVFVTEILRSWIVGFGFLLICVWVLPSLAKRLWR
jgi:hypothetical protein